MNDFKIIVLAILLFIVPYLLLIIFIAVPELTYIIIILFILFCLLGRSIFRLISMVVSNMNSNIKYNIDRKQKINKINKEKRKKRQWIDDIRNEKVLKIGKITIKCEKENLIVNGNSIPVNRIKNLEFTSKMVGVWQKKIDTFIPRNVNVRAPVYIQDYGYMYSDWNSSNFGEVIDRRRITIEEYNRIINENIEYYKEHGDTWKSTYRYDYDLEKEYYFVVILHNGQQNSYFIDYGIEYSYRLGEQAETYKMVINKLKEYIRESKEDRHLIDNLRSENIVSIGAVKIQYKNSSLIVNGNNIPINKIENFDYKYKILRVWRNTLDINEYIYSSDTDGFVKNPNYGKSVYRESISVEQYYDIVNNKNEEFEKYSYDLDKEYYISITLYSGRQKNYLINTKAISNEEVEELKMKVEKIKDIVNGLN